MTTALVIDDNRQTADALCQMLSLLKVDATAAYGPRVALLSLRENPVDIIFLDISMPGLDGFEVLAFLRREPDLREVPVVVVTSDDQPETARRVRETGALKMILKPVTVEGLEKVLEQANLVPSR
jgi:CheY-like chemotaxis protein